MVSIMVAICSGWLMDVASEASAQLLSRTDYIEAVLGERGVDALASAAVESAS